nr:stage V sporulation protein AD [Oscillospiraceae bacterium]
MAKKITRNTFLMENPPTIHSFSSTVGKKEGDGPLGALFDEVCDDAYFGQK